MSKSLNNLTPSVFSTWFSFSSDQHNYETSSYTKGNLTKLSHKTNIYGNYSITVSAVESRNRIQKQIKDMLLKDLSPRKIKTTVSKFYLKASVCYFPLFLKDKYISLLVQTKYI